MAARGARESASEDTRPPAGARAAVGATPPWKEAVIDGVRLAYDDEGHGPAVVCLHAIGHGARDFAPLRARLRDRYRIIAPDWPGHGSSEADHRPVSAARYASLLAGLLDAAAVERCVLVGNSIGGTVAVRHAAAHPEQVRGLVLENPGGLAATDDALARAVLGGMVRFFAAGTRRRSWFPRAFAAYYRLCVLQRAAAAAQRRRIVASAYEIAPVLEQAWRHFGAPDYDVRSLAPRIHCPVLVAWATRDQFVQLRRSRAAIRQFPNARLEAFRAAHAAHLETPAAFADVLEGFLAELAVGGRAESMVARAGARR
jgi:pimeloyl-ACP methyl ester carboxylesterase